MRPLSLLRPFPLLVAGFLMVASTTFGQITITRSDVESGMMPASRSYSASVGGPLDVGAEGKGVAVNFSSLAYSLDATSAQSVDPKTTPYASTFSTATHAYKSTTASGDSYIFIRLANDGLYMLGIGATQQGQPIVMQYVPDNPELKLPLTYDLKWEYSGQPIVLMGSISTETRFKKEVDASGRLTLPSGSYDYLRVKTEQYVTSKVSFGGTVISESVTKSLEYQYLTKEGVTCSVNADSSDSNTQTPVVSSVMYTVPTGTTGLSSPPLATDLRLSAAWPNPISRGGIATLSLTSLGVGSVTVRLVDVLGRDALPRATMDLQPGTQTLRIGTGNLPAGRYLLEVTGVGTRATEALLVR